VMEGAIMNKPTYRTTVGLNPESRERLDQLVEKTDRSIREIIQSGINREHKEVIKG
jgi:predicted DNA-binding protein